MKRSGEDSLRSGIYLCRNLSVRTAGSFRLEHPRLTGASPPKPSHEFGRPFTFPTAHCCTLSKIFLRSEFRP
jgi:hypothetical protein